MRGAGARGNVVDAVLLMCDVLCCVVGCKGKLECKLTNGQSDFARQLRWQLLFRFEFATATNSLATQSVARCEVLHVLVHYRPYSVECRAPADYLPTVFRSASVPGRGILP